MNIITNNKPSKISIILIILLPVSSAQKMEKAAHPSHKKSRNIGSLFILILKPLKLILSKNKKANIIPRKNNIVLPSGSLVANSKGIKTTNIKRSNNERLSTD